MDRIDKDALQTSNYDFRIIDQTFSDISLEKSPQ